MTHWDSLWRLAPDGLLLDENRDGSGRRSRRLYCAADAYDVHPCGMGRLRQSSRADRA